MKEEEEPKWYEGAETDEELKTALMKTWFTLEEKRPKETKTIDTIREIMEMNLSDQAIRLIRFEANKILNNRKSVREDGNYYG